MTFKPATKYIVWASALTVLLCVVTVIQPSYFFAKPSRYSLFSALVADRNVSVERGIAFGEHGRLKLDIYSPIDQSALKASPVVLFLYGGTWKEGDRAIYGFAGAALAARGITTVIPDYRLYPEVQFPEFLNDAARAYVWTRNRFPDPSRPVIVMGHSAGAHMAAMLALNPSYIRSLSKSAEMPDGLIGLAGPYAFDLTGYKTTKDLFLAQQDAAETIPANFANANAPPALLVHGGADETVKRINQEVLANKLKVLNVPVTTHEPAGVSHVGLIRSLAWPFRNSSPLTELIVEFVLQRAAQLRNEKP